jgi:integrase
VSFHFLDLLSRQIAQLGLVLRQRKLLFFGGMRIVAVETADISAVVGGSRRNGKQFQDAATAAGLEAFGTHTLRHSYRTWLDAVGTTIAVQQKLMRHADIRTTMNVYGTVVTDEMTIASGKVAGLAVNRTQTERKPGQVIENMAERVGFENAP